MKIIFSWIKSNPIRAMFLFPIILVGIISISHVVSWYDLANPLSWAIYLSIAIEIGAMTALIAATNRIKGGVWFMFGLVTFVQMIGNIFFSYKEIDSNGELFKSWVELTGPIWEGLGSDITDVVSLKRWLAFLEGGLLPIISLTSLHFFIKYDEGTRTVVEPEVFEKIVEVIKEDSERDTNVPHKEDTIHDTIHDEIEIPESYLTHHTTHYTPQVETIVVEKIVEVPVEVIKEVEKIVEVLVEVIKEVPVEVIREVEVIKEVFVEVIKEVEVTTTTTTEDNIKRLSYIKPD
jgi:hypothetical protein